MSWDSGSGYAASGRFFASPPCRRKGAAVNASPVRLILSESREKTAEIQWEEIWQDK